MLIEVEFNPRHQDSLEKKNPQCTEVYPLHSLLPILKKGENEMIPAAILVLYFFVSRRPQCYSVSCFQLIHSNVDLNDLQNL